MDRWVNRGFQRSEKRASCGSDGALAQAAHDPWGLLLGDLSKPPGRGPGPTALGVPTGAGLGQRDTQIPSNISHSLTDSAKHNKPFGV